MRQVDRRNSGSKVFLNCWIWIRSKNYADPHLPPTPSPHPQRNKPVLFPTMTAIGYLYILRTEPKRKYSSDLEPGGKKTKNENISNQERTLLVRSFEAGSPC
jgi:hypothetical protein